MALNAGKLKFTLEYGKDLKDMDWFGKQDPYAIIKCGTQTARSKTHIDGGRHPVWAQTFEFNIINENTIEVAVYDEDSTSRDDLIGTANVSLAKVREQKHDKAAVPLVSKKGKQHGFIHVSLAFESNDSLKQSPPAAAGYAPVAAPPAPYPYPYPPGYAMAPPMMPASPYYMPQPVMASLPVNAMGQPMYYPPGIMPAQQQVAGSASHA